ncbi:MAG: multidrug effflux MFS transporter [Gammaproteobacteria bacterium]|jgi:DHA1 family bicyclomycin/chloramphenicol resistance-like MFS transporter
MDEIKTQAAAGRGPGFVEFVIMIALMISMVALAIDAMLPALPAIASDLGIENLNDSQYVITVFFAGMALGQILFGPLSDAVGRRPAIIAGLCVLAAGSLLSLFAVNFSQMLLGRLLGGMGAAGPRIVSIALVRDRYRGREMARVMSFVMTVFILVPVFAPAVGQGILLFTSWHYIFGLFVALALGVGGWFWVRQPETLAPQFRSSFSFTNLALDTLGVLRQRAALGYALTMGFVFGAFIGYLSSSQQIFQIQYDLGELFPLYFGILASVIGIASMVNARLVMQLGMRRLSRLALQVICLLSAAFFLLAWYQGGHPHLNSLMLYLLLLFFCFGLLFGNLNSMAMEPLGHIAGLGSAVVGSLATFLSAIFGSLVSSAYDGTVLPLVLGFALLGAGGLLIMYWTESGLEAEN